MPASLTTLAHTATSALMISANACSGALLASQPATSSLCCTSGVASAASSSLLICSTTGCGIPFGTTTPNISGNRNSWNTVTVDGLVGNDLGSPQIFSGTINFDAISEVKVQLNNYQAENGRNGGAMISVVTKSGTKDYKGSAYAYKRHEKLNANDFFNNRSGIAKPPSAVCKGRGVLMR